MIETDVFVELIKAACENEPRLFYDICMKVVRDLNQQGNITEAEAIEKTVSKKFDFFQEKEEQEIPQGERLVDLFGEPLEPLEPLDSPEEKVNPKDILKSKMRLRNK